MCPQKVFKMTSAEKVEEEISLDCSRSYLGEVEQNLTVHVVAGRVRRPWFMRLHEVTDLLQGFARGLAQRKCHFSLTNE